MEGILIIPMNVQEAGLVKVHFLPELKEFIMLEPQEVSLRNGRRKNTIGRETE